MLPTVRRWVPFLVANDGDGWDPDPIGSGRLDRQYGFDEHAGLPQQKLQR